jgi:hypothetical protein
LVTGLLEDVATFGEGETNEIVLTSALYNDIFVAKYNPEGALIWAAQAECFSCGGFGIAVDHADNSLVTGDFSYTATFGVGEPNETELANSGGGDIFVASYAPDGALNWAMQAGLLAWSHAQGIAVDGGGSCLVTGLFTGSATFGAGELNETTLVSEGEYDIFLAKWGQEQEGADVFLRDLRMPKAATLRVDKQITKRIVAVGDAVTLAQDTTVTLSVEAGPGLEVVVEPEAVTLSVEPGKPLSRFPFAAQIGCDVVGTHEIIWTATIDAAENADPTNDTVTQAMRVDCR